MPSPLTRPLRTWVLRAFPRGESGLDYDNPTDDPGLFDPASATWQVHADFAGMLSGGLCALVLQTLHPAALAGVWDHSNFRTDLVGRLRRTTHFVAGTSYAPRAQAQAQIARVRRIHDRVQGVTQTGEAYSANDPALLTWVHVTEAYGFLQGYRRFAGPVPGPDADRYYDETRRIAEALGATDVPRSEAEVADYFKSVQPRLAYTDRSREVLRVLDAPEPRFAMLETIREFAGEMLDGEGGYTVYGKLFPSEKSTTLGSLPLAVRRAFLPGAGCRFRCRPPRGLGARSGFGRAA